MSPRFPFPDDPIGWFCIGAARALRPGELRTVTLFGRELVWFRTQAGRHGLFDAFCPHMGGHFGHGGRVCGEQLRCPFHAFLFDPDGACATTPYGQEAPRAAQARSWPLHEHAGLVFAWHHPAGEAPTWTLPELPEAGWTDLALHRFDLASHPQEISENSVDTGHFAAVHHYAGLEVVSPLEVDGPALRTTYAFQRAGSIFGLSGTVRFEIAIQVLGLGCSIVDVHTDRLPLHSRQYVLPVSTHPGRCTLHIGMRLERPPRWRDLSPGLFLLPDAIAEPLVGAAMIRLYAHEVAQDLHIWENKAYLHPPALARGDGPVGRYRAWCRQFYPPASPEGARAAG